MELQTPDRRLSNKRTNRHECLCYTVEAWQERQDSNPRPSVLETDALTRLSYAPKPLQYNSRTRFQRWSTYGHITSRTPTD